MANAAALSLSLSGMLPPLAYEFIQRAQRDHEDAPAALMREHARRGRGNKRELLKHLRERSQL